MTPAEFLRFTQRLRMTMEVECSVAVGEAAKLIQQEAKAHIGEQREWPPLAEATIREKEALGEQTPAPLLRTGVLRDSIEVRHEGLEAIVGTNDPKALAHEHGTSHVPPRPFLSTAARTKADEATMIMRKAVLTAFEKLKP